MKLIEQKGKTSKLVEVFIQDSSSTVGAGLAGLVFDSASLTAYYYRSGAGSAVEISLVTMTIGTWVSGGFVEIDAVNLPGVYQLGLPDAVLAHGIDQVIVMLKGATDMAPLLLEIQFNTGTSLLSTGTAQSGGASNIQLQSNENAISSVYNGVRVTIVGGLGAGQARMITAYNGSTKDATIAPGWYIQPDGTSIYELQGADATVAAILNEYQSAADLKDFVDRCYNPSTNKIAGLVLCDSNTDMRGTDSAATSIQAVAIIAAIAALNNISVADVNAQVVDVIRTDTKAELVGVPAANAPLHDMLQWIFSKERNKQLTTAGGVAIRNGDDDADIAAATASDDGTTFTRGKFA